ncbi:hypothetical protein E2C01_063167 [Portunus trituberculatus]|uniref:Secreted protein n=1 Tax=Portunus trituberculatus TaxID=210409 RepID=A0A5B7HK25_PORTR|nr:hypothetical protein [Portunus trituberculatus]
MLLRYRCCLSYLRTCVLGCVTCDWRAQTWGGEGRDSQGERRGDVREMNAEGSNVITTTTTTTSTTTTSI